MRATSALRTAVGLGSRLPTTETVVAIDMALYKRLVSLGELDAYLAANTGRRGVASSS